MTCFDCHHTDSVVHRLTTLNSGVEFYKGSVGRILKIKGNRSMLVQEGDTAYRTAQALAAQVNDMVHMASSKLSDKTAASLKTITGSKRILYALVVITPFIAAGLCFIFIREFAKPVKQLLKATRKLQSGDLDYRIEGLKDEFGEVATSFNEMSESLKGNIHAIQESENRYRTLFEQANDAIFLTNQQDEIIDVQPTNHVRPP